MSYLKHKVKKLYYIGGSPCSGKSTAAEMLAKEFGGISWVKRKESTLFLIKC